MYPDLVQSWLINPRQQEIAVDTLEFAGAVRWQFNDTFLSLFGKSYAGAYAVNETIICSYNKKVRTNHCVNGTNHNLIAAITIFRQKLQGLSVPVD